MQNKKSLDWNQFFSTLSAVIVGGLLSFIASYGLWNLQVDKKHELGVKDKREQLIVQAADLFSRAPRLKGIFAGHLVQINSAQLRSKFCIAMNLQGKPLDSCKDDVDYSAMSEFNSEIFDSMASFNKLNSLINLYFCDRTKSKFSKINKLDYWWDLSSQDIKEVLNTMHIEYTCNL